jgi:hypothetical protein
MDPTSDPVQSAWLAGDIHGSDALSSEMLLPPLTPLARAGPAPTDRLIRLHVKPIRSAPLDTARRRPSQNRRRRGSQSRSAAELSLFATAVLERSARFAPRNLIAASTLPRSLDLRAFGPRHHQARRPSPHCQTAFCLQAQRPAGAVLLCIGRALPRHDPPRTCGQPNTLADLPIAPRAHSYIPPMPPSQATGPLQMPPTSENHPS